MTTHVNLHSSLDSNVTQSKGIEPEVLQFSIINFLPPDDAKKDSSPVLPELEKEEQAFQELPDECKELTASEFLQYWELPPPPIPSETLTNAESDQLTLSNVENQIATDSLPETLSNRVTINLENRVENEPPKLRIEDVIPLNTYIEPDKAAVIAPMVIQQTTISKDISESEVRLNPLVMEMDHATTKESLPRASTPKESMLQEPTPTMFDSETQQIITALINDKEPDDIYSYQTIGHMINQNEKEYVFYPASSADKRDVPPARLMEQNQSLPPISDFLIQPKSDNFSSIKHEAFITQPNSAPTLETQAMVNNDARIEQLTNHMNQFLNQSTLNNVTSPGADANSIQSQFRMELLSLKPEILADHSNYSSENYTAEINLHPAELGQITAKIEVIQGAASITFMTEHAHVQQLMEHHLPALHEVFQNSDLNLTSVNIFNGGAQDKNESNAQKRPEEDDDLKPMGNRSQNIAINKGQRKNSIIDTYA